MLNVHMYKTCVFDEDTISNWRKKGGLFKKWCSDNWLAIWKEKVGSSLYPSNKTSSIWIKDLNI